MKVTDMVRTKLGLSRAIGVWDTATSYVVASDLVLNRAMRRLQQRKARSGQSKSSETKEQQQ